MSVWKLPKLLLVHSDAIPWEEPLNLACISAVDLPPMKFLRYYNFCATANISEPTCSVSLCAQGNIVVEFSFSPHIPKHASCIASLAKKNQKQFPFALRFHSSASLPAWHRFVFVSSFYTSASGYVFHIDGEAQVEFPLHFLLPDFFECTPKHCKILCTLITMT